MDHSPGESLDVGHVAAQSFVIVVVSGTEDDDACIQVCFMTFLNDK